MAEAYIHHMPITEAIGAAGRARILAACDAAASAGREPWTIPTMDGATAWVAVDLTQDGREEVVCLSRGEVEAGRLADFDDPDATVCVGGTP